MGKRLSPEQWAEIVCRYTVGREPAKVLAHEFGISKWSVYKRAVRVGWTDPIDKSGDSARVVDKTLIARLESSVDRLERIIGGVHGRSE